MNPIRQLDCLPRSVDAFGDRLCALWEEGVRSIYLIGEPDWAAALEASVSRRGVALRHCAYTDVQGLAGTPGKKAVVFGEADGARLGGQLLSCVDLDDVVVVASQTDWHFTQKPLFLISIPKAGTHLLYELVRALGYEAGIECPAFPRGKTWYCVEYSNSHTVARDFFVDTVRHAAFGNRHHSFMRSPALFMYRHPLDVLVSEAHYYHRDGKSAFAGWLSECSFEERIERLCNGNWLMGSLRERIGGFLPWMAFPNVIPVSFEQLIGAAGGGTHADQRDLIWSIQLKLQVPGSADEIAARVFNPRSATFHAGQIGAYQQQLSAQTIASWSESNADILAALGYPADGSLGMPAQRAAQRRRPLRLSQADGDRIPVIVEPDFLGCNLVRYDGRIYAIPRSAGAVALDQLPAARRAALPCATSVGELKSLLLVGATSLNARTEALSRLAAHLQDESDGAAVHRYWQEEAEPAVIGTYGEFNVVAYRGLFIGLRQSLGAFDFSGDPRRWIQQCAVSDMAICTSLAQLHSEIDGLATVRRVREEAMATQARLLERIDMLEKHVASLEDRLAWQDGQLASQAGRLASQEDRLASQEASMAHTLKLRDAENERLDARKAALAQRCAELDARVQDIESSWTVRIGRVVTRATRGRT